jgi:hypothetical protein
MADTISQPSQQQHNEIELQLEAEVNRAFNEISAEQHEEAQMATAPMLGGQDGNHAAVEGAPSVDGALQAATAAVTPNPRPSNKRTASEDDTSVLIDTNDPVHQPYKHHTDVTRAKVRGVIEYAQSRGLRVNKTDVFKAFGVPTRSGWRLLSKNASRDKDDPNWEETRGRKKKIPPELLKEVDEHLQTYGAESYEKLRQGIPNLEGVSNATIRKALGTSLDYCRCLVCQSAWVSPAAAANRVAFAQECLRSYPTQAQWRTIRFAYELHFEISSASELHFQRQPGERYCGNCVKGAPPLRDGPRHKGRLHAWVAVGHGFKSDLVFYTCRAPHGKLNQKEYIALLERTVKPWLDRGDQFILEESAEGEHGPKDNNNVVQKWKKKAGLHYYMNFASGEDVNVAGREWLETTKVRTPDQARNVIMEAWGKVRQEWIDHRVEFLPLRLSEVIQNGGKLSTSPW